MESQKEKFLSFFKKDFLLSREGRIIRIASEYLEPEKRLAKNNVLHTVVFFGSARTPHDDPYYKAAEEFAFELTKLGDEIEKEIGANFFICSGGGPGIMEAANRGAHRAGKKSIGLNIELPHEQTYNPYMSKELHFEFNYFFMRKFWFLYQAKAIIGFPGGFGTLDELFEVLTLMQTRKINKFDLPVLLYDKDFWYSLINFDKLVDMGLISPEDMDMIHFFKDANEGIEYLRPKIKEYMQYLELYHEI